MNRKNASHICLNPISHLRRAIPYAVLCLTLFSACKTQKLTQDSQQDSQPILSEADLIQKLRAQPHFSHINAKAKVAVKSSQGNMKGILYIRGKKDSVIWSAAKKLSVEGARIQITPETATMLNRLDKTYQIYPLDTLQQVYGITGDMSYLEAIYYGYTPVLDSLALWEVDRSAPQQLTVRSLAQNVIHDISIDKITGNVTGGQFKSKIAGEGTWTFGDYRIVKDDIYLPYYRKYDIYLSQYEYISLELKFSEIEIDIPKSIPFSVPSHYKRIP